MLDEPEGCQEHRRSAERKGEQDPSDGERPMFADIAAHQESCKPDTRDHLQAEAHAQACQEEELG